MKHSILVMSPLPEPQMGLLEEHYNLYKLWKSKDPESLIKENRLEITGLISTAWHSVSRKLIEALPNLEIISNYGVGYEKIDLEAVNEHKVIVTNTPDVLTDDTADFAIGLMLSLMRRMIEGDMYVRTGQWAKKGMLPLGRSLSAKKIGIVGLGRIGRAIAVRAEAFGMKVCYFGPNKKPAIPYIYYDDLIKMAEDTDVLMLSCPGGDNTKHLINKKSLEALGENGFLINISRGSVVNEEDLIEALQSNTIAGAALDVYENEPDVPSAFTTMDNIVLQPHQGSGTIETRQAMAQLVFDNLESYFKKGITLTPVQS